MSGRGRDFGIRGDAQVGGRDSIGEKDGKRKKGRECRKIDGGKTKIEGKNEGKGEKGTEEKREEKRK